jgi:protein-disulfide isomerase
VNHSATVGSRQAQLGMIEYSDFECPFCSRFATDVMPTLKREYVETGKLMIVFRHLPLEIHDQAEGAAVASVCAGKQEHFWQAHDALFTLPSALQVERLQSLGAALGLDIPTYHECLDAEATRALVAADKGEAARLGITGTPTFLLGTLEQGVQVRVVEALTGAKPIAAFRAAIERLLDE